MIRGLVPLANIPRKDNPPPSPLSHPSVADWLEQLVVFPDDVANKIHNRIATTDIAVRRFPPGYQLFEKKGLASEAS